MYKLLLVSDQKEVLDAFEQVQDWERHGFKAPHLRHDFEGAKDSLAKHHADGIAIAVDSEEEEKILAYLQEFFPNVPIFEAGKNRDEVLRYLNELNILLNRIHADFSNDQFTEADILQQCRHEFFRKAMRGKVHSREDMRRSMRLLRSRMEAGMPCMVVELGQLYESDEDKLEGKWQYSDDRLELRLRNSFGGDLDGIHILPTVHPDGRILVLCCALHGTQFDGTEDRITAKLTTHIAEGIVHMKEFFGLELHMTGIKVLPSLYALCTESSGEENKK